MRPNRPRIIGLAAVRHATNAERKLIRRTSSKSSSLIRKIKPSRVMPALLTMMSNRPCRSAISSIAVARAAPSPTSHDFISQVPPAEMISTRRSSNCSALRANPTRCRPSAARRIAIALPIPRLAPVTIATLFSMTCSFLGVGS